MLRSLAGIGRALAVCWPALVAWYLAGQAIRWTVIVIAAPLTGESTLGALLIVPIAILAKLFAFVGMFLTLRRAMPGYRAISGGDVTFSSFREAVAEFLNVLLVTIGPFFTIYALLGLLIQDIRTYGNLAFRNNAEGAVFDASGPLVLTIVVAALGLRLLLRVVGRRLPTWVGFFEMYLEATWILVALTGLIGALGAIISWINNRQIVVWIGGAIDWVSGLWEPLRLAILSVDWLIPVVQQIVLLPLAWLLIGAIVYIRALADVESDALPRSVGRRLQEALARLPEAVRRNRHILTGAWEDLGAPIALTGRMLVRTGALDASFYLAAYGLLSVVTAWVSRGLYFVVGPQETNWWFDFQPILGIAVDTVFEPVRIALIAFAFDRLLLVWQASRTPSLAVPPPDVATTPVRAGGAEAAAPAVRGSA